MASFDEYEKHDALGLAALIRAGEVSATEVLEAAIARIDARNPLVNAVVHRLDAQARASAAALSLRSARASMRPFEGVPWLVKDSGIQIAGERTSNGSRFWRDHVAPHDSTITQRYRAAGLNLLGWTNSAENGLSCETAPVAYGPTRNPWDTERSPGGSSGGAAAAVAAGLVPAAHATDGGGSIRIPSSCNGLFGLKPSRGRNPFGPDVGEGWNGLSVHHAITRTVRDSAALLDASHGPETGDPYAAPPTGVGSFSQDLLRPRQGLRIAFQTVDHAGQATHPAVAGAVVDAAHLLASLGHQVVEARPSFDAQALKRAMFVVVASNTAHVLRARALVAGRPASRDEVEPITWLWAQEGHRLPGVDLAAAINTLHAVGRAMGRFFEQHDVLLTPTCAAPPLPIRTVDTRTEDLAAYYDALHAYNTFTTPYNCAGVPAASVPLHWADGLPIGVQMASGFGRDAVLLNLAAQLEAARPWFDRRPERWAGADWGAD